jgi:hypothetical protein
MEHPEKTNLDYLDQQLEELQASPVEMLVLFNRLVGALSAHTDTHVWRAALDRALAVVYESRAETPTDASAAADAPQHPSGGR